MTTIRSGGVRPVQTPSTQSAPTAKSSQAASGDLPGYSASSSFQAATSSTTSSNAAQNAIFSAAKDTLKKAGGGDAEELSKLLDKTIPDDKGLQKAMELFEKVSGQMSPEDAKTVEKALVQQLMGKTTLDRLRQSSEKMLQELNNKKKWGE